MWRFILALSYRQSLRRGVLPIAVAGVLGTPEVAAQQLTYLHYPYPPYSMTIDGELTGYMSDMMQAVLRRTGLPTEIMEASVVRAITDTQGKPNHFTAATNTAEMRERRPVRWVFCFETVTHSLVVKKAQGYGSIAAIPREAKIGAFINYTLRDHLASVGFTKIEYVRENALLANLLEKDRIDAWASFGAAALYLLETRGVDLREIEALPIQKFPFCGVTSNTTSEEIVARARSAYRQIALDGTRSAIRSRYARYLDVDQPPPLPDLASLEPESQ